MEQQYSVSRNGQPVGKVSVTKQGLYYRFHCRCSLPKDGIFRLAVSSGSMQTPLGVLVPYSDGFGLDTKVPVRQVGEGELAFQISPNRESVSGNFVPILDEEPFAYISRLKTSFLTVRNGQAGIEI